VVGTIYTMSPETIRGEYNQQADMWSIGVIAYQLLSGEKPFTGKDHSEVAKSVIRAKYNFESKAWTNISKDAKDFIKHLLLVDPQLRYTAEQALQAPWLATHILQTSRNLNRASVRSLFVSDSDCTQTSEFRKLALNIIAHKATSQEIVKWRDVFHAIDDDHDGCISAAELKKGLGSHFEEKELDAWFKQADVDDSGRVDYTEFIAAMLEAHGEIQSKQIDEAFRIFDQENKGYITPENLRGVLGVSEDSEYVELLLREADANGDGKISYREFRDVLSNHQQALVSKVGGEGIASIRVQL
jgi:calcium-dependent protein kinase